MKSSKTIVLLALVGVLGFAAYRVNQKPEAPKPEEEPAYVLDDKAKEVLLKRMPREQISEAATLVGEWRQRHGLE